VRFSICAAPNQCPYKIINLIHKMPMSFVYLFSTNGNDTHFLLLPILAINVRFQYKHPTLRKAY
jgi:hypothetical protein